MQTTDWTVHLYFEEDDDDTHAKAVLHTRPGESLALSWHVLPLHTFSPSNPQCETVQRPYLRGRFNRRRRALGRDNGPP